MTKSTQKTRLPMLSKDPASPKVHGTPLEDACGIGKNGVFRGAFFPALLLFPVLSINIQAGYDKQFVGNGMRSMVLSDFSSPSLFLKINTQTGVLSIHQPVYRLFIDAQVVYRHFVSADEKRSQNSFIPGLSLRWNVPVRQHVF